MVEIATLRAAISKVNSRILLISSILPITQMYRSRIRIPATIPPMTIADPKCVSIAQFDRDLCEYFIKFADLAMCALTLRATSRAFRAMIAAPRRTSPQTMWKWAMRHGFATYAREARYAGAQDLAKYCDSDDGIDCATWWDEQFATDRELCRGGKYGMSFDIDQLDDVLAVIRGDAKVISTYCEYTPCISHYGATLIGKYAHSDDVLRAFKFYVKVPNILDGIIYGVMKSRRDDLCKQIIETRIKAGGLMMEMSGMGLSTVQCTKFREFIHLQNFTKDSALRDAAMSGDVQVCTFVDELFATQDKRLHIARILQGAALSRNGVEICKLARKWLDTADPDTVIHCCDFGTTMIKKEYNRGNYITSELNCALTCAAQHGNRAVCEYLIEWGANDFETMLRVAYNYDMYWIVDIACREMLVHGESIVHLTRTRGSRACKIIISNYMRIQLYNKSEHYC